MWTQQLLHPTHKPFLLIPPHPIPSKTPSFQQLRATHNGKSKSSFKSSIKAITALEEELPPNALRRKRDPQWSGGFSLGVDLGMARTGLALSKGFSIRPLTVNKQSLIFSFFSFSYFCCFFQYIMLYAVIIF